MGRVTLAYAYELGDTRVPRCDPHGRGPLTVATPPATVGSGVLGS